MSEDTTINDTNNTEVEDVESGGIDNLRTAYKQEKAERKALQQELMNVALSSMGLDPTKGVGKAVLKTYDGKPNIEEIKSFVTEEFGDVVNSTPVSNQEPQESVSDNVIQAQSRVDQINKIGVSSQPVDVMDAFRDVVKSGNVTQSLRAKMALIEQQNKK
jgi:hypothetical protein